MYLQNDQSPYYGSIVWECLKNLEIKVNEV